MSKWNPDYLPEGAIKHHRIDTDELDDATWLRLFADTKRDPGVVCIFDNARFEEIAQNIDTMNFLIDQSMKQGFMKSRRLSEEDERTLLGEIESDKS